MRKGNLLPMLLGAIVLCSDALCAETSDGETDGGAGLKEQQKPGVGLDGRPLLKKFMGKMSQEEIEKLKSMHDENPEAFRAEMMKRMRERKDEFEEKNSKSMELSKKYHSTDDEAEKARIKEELTSAVASEFDEKMKKNRERFEKAEKQMQEFKRKIEEREKNRGQIIRDRMDELLKDPDLKW
jgi:hypothetical protein